MKKLIAKIKQRIRWGKMNDNDKFLLSLGVEITNDYIHSRSFRRIIDKTQYGKLIQSRIKNWNKNKNV
jgi:hypothetical protein|tara:strand:+ start:12198 stop:12401 length:204 start_codon:yes stop_codon:yes gene_type:complete